VNAAVIAFIALAVVLVASGVTFTYLRRQTIGAATPAVRRARAIGGIDPFAVNEPWRLFVRDALNARERFREVAATAALGPLKDRLAEIGERVDEGVDQVWATARRGHELRQARRRIDTEAVEQRIAEAQRLAEANLADDTAARTLGSLTRQLETAQRLDSVTVGAEAKLRLLQAQLDELAARAAELAVRAGDVSELSDLGADVDSLVEEMESLRKALDEVDQAGSTDPGTALA
jgi:chromosome segregation ATPase